MRAADQQEKEQPSSSPKQHNKRRLSGLLLRFTDLPSWPEEEAKRREEKRRKEHAQRPPRTSAAYVRIPSLQELSARVSAVAIVAVPVENIPDGLQVILDLVRAYMCKSTQITVFGSFKDYYAPLTPPSPPSRASLSSSSSSSSLHQPPKTTILRTLQRYGTHSQLDGESLWYFRNGNMECQEHYQLDQLHGPARTWYESGQMESEREWSEGALQGQIREWYPNGSLKTHEVWRSGVREKIIVADGRTLTDRTRDFLFGSRLRTNASMATGSAAAGNGRQGAGLDWLSLDGVSSSSGGRSRSAWRG